MREWLDKRTGEIKAVPVGIDPGFGYNVGVASSRAASLDGVVAERLAKATPGLARAARADGMATWHSPTPVTAAAAFVRRSVSTPKTKQPLEVLGSISSLATQRAQALGVELSGRALALEHDGVLHTLKSHGQPSEALRWADHETSACAIRRRVPAPKLGPKAQRQGPVLFESPAMRSIPTLPGAAWSLGC